MKNYLNLGQNDVKKAAKSLKDGHLVVFPTETVYGLGADAMNQRAVARVYELKARPQDHPLIVHIASVDQLFDWAIDIPNYAEKLAEKFWPGPMTLILKKSEIAKDFVTGSQATIGVRIPSHPMAQSLLIEFNRLGGLGIAAPSVNKFGEVSATTNGMIDIEIANLLTNKDLVLDGGKSSIGIESTIIDCSNKIPTILRPGWITEEMITKYLDFKIIDLKYKSSIKHSGSFQSHYKPKCKIILGQEPQIGDGMFALSKFKTPPGVIRLGAPRTVEEFARNMYLALSLADRKKMKNIHIIPPEGKGLAEAIRDRLKKASHT
jgi:L-threonylcarbamoyladenylate synthase